MYFKKWVCGHFQIFLMLRWKTREGTTDQEQMWSCVKDKSPHNIQSTLSLSFPELFSPMEEWSDRMVLPYIGADKTDAYLKPKSAALKKLKKYAQLFKYVWGMEWKKKKPSLLCHVKSALWIRFPSPSRGSVLFLTS